MSCKCKEDFKSANTDWDDFDWARVHFSEINTGGLFSGAPSHSSVGHNTDGIVKVEKKS